MNTAPSIVGYYNGTDRHGAGTGTWLGGGTLKSPYYRNYPPIPCETCHSGPHASYDMPYLLKNNINGKPIVGNYLDTNGYIYVLARARHDGVAPVITVGPTVTILAYNSVRIDWSTNENATSWVDYGLTASYGNTAGNGSYVTSHSVNLAGLTNHNTYHYRINSTDALGNSLLTGDYTYNLNVPPPVPAGLSHQSNWAGVSNPFTATLSWNAVTDPDGGPVQYQAVVSTDPNFGSLYYDSNWISGTTCSVTLPKGSYNYYWRVRSRDGAHTSAVSNWSANDNFSSPALTAGPSVTNLASTSATITWSTNRNATSWVDYGLTTGYGGTAGNGGYVASHSVGLTGLTNHNTYHYRLISTDALGDTLVTGDYTFVLDFPPPVPAIIDQPNWTTGSSSFTVTLSWNAVTDPDGGPVEYEVLVSTDSNFGGTPTDSGWVSGTSWPVTVNRGYTYYWKVRSRDAAHPAVISNWSAVDSFYVLSAAPPLAPTLLSPPSPGNGSYWELDYSPSTVGFGWSAVTAPDGHSCQYLVQVSQASDFSSFYADSGWLVAGTTSWSLNVDTGATYYWRVKARDSVETDAESGWAGPWYFTIGWWVKSSCPLIYVWTGKEYKYQTDSEIGTLGQSPKTDIYKYVGLYKESYIKLDMIKPDSQGNYRIKLREGQMEADYLDNLKLLVVDHPIGTSVYDATAMNTYNYGYRTEPKIYTVKNARVPKKAWYKDGSDVTALVNRVDNKPAPAKYGEIDYYIFDFGPIRNTANAKLLIDGWTVFGLPALTGIAADQAPYIELVDAQGNWKKVRNIGFPAGDLKTMVVDLGGLFLSQNYRIKLCTGIQSTYKFVFDQVRLDESAPVLVKTQLLAATYADLHYRGRPSFRYTNLESRLRAQDDVLPDLPKAYLYGAFTRYGDVRELISQTDDKFAIMRHGDELTLTFPKPTPIPRGHQRSIMLMSDLFFKVKNPKYQPLNWDQATPLPYHGMDKYPPSTDKYANDPDYQNYLQTYNTRVYVMTASLMREFMATAALPEAPSAEVVLAALNGAWTKGQEYLQNTLAGINTSGGGLEGSLAFLAYDFMPRHYSLNTNYVEVKITDNSGAGFTYNITNTGAQAWQNAPVPYPTAPGTQATIEQKTAIAAFDFDRWTTSLVSADNTYNHQMYRFQVTQPLTNLGRLDVTWRGYGEPTAGYNVELFLWNFSTNSWDNINSAFASTDTLITGSRSLTALDRAGRGAEALCTACHQGNYHQACMNCHNNGTDHLGTPTLCLSCHSHNGIRNFPDPQTTARPSNPLAYGCHCHDDPWYDMVERDCTHCHGSWFPYSSVNDTTAPTLTGGPTVSNIQGDRATITWSTNEASTSYVTYGTTTSYGAKVGSANMVTSHTVNLTGLTPATTYHYRVRSADAVNNEMGSGDFTFSTYGANPPTTPVLIDQPDVYDPGASASTVTLQWNASTGYNGHPVQYYVQVDDANNFGSPNYVSGWISGTSWTVTVAAPQVYYWRVQARDALYPAVNSNWSSADTFTVRVASPPPPPALVHNPGGSIYAYTFTLGVDPPAQPLQWNPVSAPDGDPVEYYVQLSFDPNFSSIYASSSWTAALSWNLTVDAGATYYWRVMSRDAVHWTSTSGWSAVDNFYIECTIPPPSSCPFIYVWDGEGYQYLTDIQGEALSMSTSNPIYKNKYFPLYGPSYVVLDALKLDGANLYRLKIREVQSEVDYFDEAKLLLADYPVGYEIVSSSAENTYHFGYVNPFKIYTLKDPRPPISAVDQNGNDILDKVLAVDNNPAPPDIQAPEFYTFDFGPIAHPENAKLVLDGWSIYGSKVYNPLPSLPADITPYVELINTQGQWQKVRTFGILAGDLKTMVVDLSGLFLSSDHRIRLNLGYSKSARTMIDRVRLDDSAPVMVTVTEVAALSADLHHRGWATVDFADLQHRHAASDDTQPENQDWYLYGAFTRYGDVLPLLAADDDKLVLMRHGDELSLVFPGIALPAYGLERKALLKADVYYKSNKFSNKVEPLPYNGMTVYPPDPWLGPTSADYLQYLQDYNTRIYEVPTP